MANSDRKEKIYINFMGHYHPNNIIKNKFYADLNIGCDDKWIEQRTGIKERRSVIKEEDLLDLALGNKSLKELRKENKVESLASISKNAFELIKSNLSSHKSEEYFDYVKGNIGLVICGTSIPDFDIPSNASVIANLIDLKNIPTLDINAACSSFIVGVNSAVSFLNSNAFNLKNDKRIVLFNPERYSIRMNYKDRGSCMLFGDGASSAIISKEHSDGSFEIIDSFYTSAPQLSDLITIEDEGFFTQDGPTVFKYAVEKSVEAGKLLLSRNNINDYSNLYYIGHQANMRILKSTADGLKISGDKHLTNIEFLGNQGSAGAPAVLSQNFDKFKKGDFLIMTGVGSGVSYGSILLKKT